MFTPSVIVVAGCLIDPNNSLFEIARDDFKNDTTAKYQTKGDVNWAPGKMTLGRDARLVRPVKFGTVVNLTATVLLPEGDGAAGVQLGLLTGQRGGTAVSLVKDRGAVRLILLQRPRAPVSLGLARKQVDSWEIQLQMTEGVVRAKAWRTGAEEPTAWQRVCESGSFEPTEFAILSGNSPGGNSSDSQSIARWSISGTKPASPLSAEQQKTAARASVLQKKVLELADQSDHPADAVPLAEEVYRITAGAFGERHARSVYALANRGEVYRLAGRHREAQDDLERALQLTVERCGNMHPIVGGIQKNLGSLYLDRADPERAEQSLRGALAIAIEFQGEGDLAVAALSSTLGVAQDSLLAFTRAEESHRAAVTIYTRTAGFGPGHPATLTARSNLALHFRDIGEDAKARTILEGAVKDAAPLRKNHHPVAAVLLSSLADLLAATGDTTPAREYFDEALRICQDEAIFGPNHPATANVMNSFAALLKNLEEYDEAERLWTRALKIREATYPDGNPRIATTLNNLGALHAAQGKFTSARDDYERALREVRRASKVPDQTEALILANLGVLERESGNLTAAESHMKESVAIYQRTSGEQSEPVAAGLFSWAKVQMKAGNAKEAWSLLVRSNSAYVSSALRQLPLSARRDHQFRFVATLDAYLALIGLAAKNPDLARERAPELASAVLAVKCVSAEAARLRLLSRASNATPAVRKAAATLTTALEDLAQLQWHGPASGEMDRFNKRLAELQKRVDDCERELAALADAGPLRAQRSPNVTAVVAHIPERGVLVECVWYAPFEPSTAKTPAAWGKPRYAAIVMSRPKPGATHPAIQFTDLGEAKEVDAAIIAWRTAEGVAKPGVPPAAAERSLRQRVWDPVKALLPEGTERLIIAPDGELSTIPFEAIRIDGGGYLVEKYEVSYVTSGSDLTRPRAEKPRDPRAVILYNPDYNFQAGPAGANPPGDKRPAIPPLDPLDYGKDEAQEIIALFERAFPNATVIALAEAKASKDALRKELDGRPPRLLYVVTHGFYLPDLPWRLAPALEFASSESRGVAIVPVGAQSDSSDPRLRCGLALAGYNVSARRPRQGASTGVLSALEAESFDLRETDLVVLSACSTSEGQVLFGQGSLNLRRSFQDAGARTVLASLRTVPDASTRRLMTLFMGNWLGKMPMGKSKAFHKAQVDLIGELRQSADLVRKTAPPYYWASFICHGDPE